MFSKDMAGHNRIKRTLESRCEAVDHRKLKAQFVSHDTIPWTWIKPNILFEGRIEWSRAESSRVESSRVLGRCSWTSAPSVDRDTIDLSTTRYTAYDWHARSVTSCMYASSWTSFFPPSPPFLPPLSSSFFSLFFPSSSSSFSPRATV